MKFESQCTEPATIKAAGLEDWRKISVVHTVGIGPVGGSKNRKPFLVFFYKLLYVYLTVTLTIQKRKKLIEIKFTLTWAYGMANDINDDTGDTDIRHPFQALLGESSRPLMHYKFFVYEHPSDSD